MFHTPRLLGARCAPKSISSQRLIRAHYSSNPFITSVASAIPHLIARELSDCHQQQHICKVNHHLQTEGILKISLGFSDDKSQYLENLIMGLGTYHSHGPPITHSACRGWFWDVRPDKTPRLPQNNVRARSETMREFPWHTDCSYEHAPPRYFALQVLQPDRCGGGTLSVMKIDQLTRFLSLQARAALFEPEFRIKVPPEFIKQNNELHITGSILGINEDDLSTIMRFREDIVTPMTTRATFALEELKSALKDLELSSQTTLHLKAAALPERSINLLDNRRWLHARNDVKDPLRHLRRVRWNAIPFSRVQTSDKLVEMTKG